MALVPDRLKEAAREAIRGAATGALREVAQVVAKVPPAGASEETAGLTPVYVSRIPHAPDAHPEALVIACSSFVFDRQTQDFVEQGLGLVEYDFVSVPGGIQWWALPDILPKHNRVARWMGEFLVRRHGMKRVIAIAHEHCSAYEDDSTLGTLAHLATGKSVREHQIAQLRHVGRELAASLGVVVELYYASVADDRSVAFHRIPADEEQRR